MGKVATLIFNEVRKYNKITCLDMKINSNTKITGTNIVLVPYKKHHVPKYHEWMKSEELQKLTASEPLSLEEEYVMQKSWQEDEDKCTFIILEKSHYSNEKDEVGSMIGDTNIYVMDKDEQTGEIEIMIAEASARGKRRGWEAVILMLLYGIDYIHLKTFEAKISFENTISKNMFKRLGFAEQSRSDVFQEVTLEKKVCEEWKKWLEKQYEYKVEQY